MRNKRGIRTRLILIFVSMTTALLAVFGIYNYFKTKHEIERQLIDAAQALTSRLKSGLPGPLWEMNLDQAGVLLDGEMVASEVSAIVVRNGAKVVIGRVRDSSGKLVSANAEDKPKGAKSSADLEIKDGGVVKPIGLVDVYMSTDRIDSALQDVVLSIVVQVVLQNLALVAVLNWVLNAIVLRPLNRVRGALGLPVGKPI